MDFLSHFETELQNSLDFAHADKSFTELLKYQFFPSGKRLRPLLIAALAKDLAIRPSKILPLAVAIEILHTASLIHDDLPALDNDKERRGRPTLHVVQGEARALLVGDLLISRAFKVLSGCQSAALQVMVAEAFEVVCYGQVLDIQNVAADIETSLRLYDYKTGSLFYACFEGVRIIAALGPEVAENFRELAYDLGRAFQLLNDLKDLDPLDKERSTSSDVKNDRVTALSRLPLNDRSKFVDSQIASTWHRLKQLEFGLGQEFEARNTREVLNKIFNKQ